MSWDNGAWFCNVCKKELVCQQYVRVKTIIEGKKKKKKVMKTELSLADT